MGVTIVVSQETHQDGNTHLHGYVHLSKQYTARGEHKLLKYGAHYPNVQPCQSKWKWLKYLSKEDKEPASYGMDLQEALHAHAHKNAIIGKRLQNNERLVDIVQEEVNTHHMLNYAGLVKSVNMFNLDKLYDQRAETDGTKGLFIEGPPGCGKSRKVRDIARKYYKEEPFTLSNTTGWFDGYKG